MKEIDSCEMSSLSSAELRKIRKPLIERKRRERINDSLEQLKVLLLQAYNRHDPQYTKMEKADILEMAVEHLQYLRANQATRPPSAYELAQKYAAGFRECATEVTRCLASFPEVKPDIRSRVMRHLNTYIDTMSACNGFLVATQTANQNQGYVFTANQRPDYNGNTITPDLMRSQFSPPIATAPKNHVIHVPKPIKLDPYHYDNIANKKTNNALQGNQNCHIGDLKSIETVRSRTDLIESPPEEASTSMQSNESNTGSSRKRSRESDEYLCVDTVSRKLDFEDTEEPLSKRVAIDSSQDTCSAFTVKNAPTDNAARCSETDAQNNNNNKVNNENALRNDARNTRYEGFEDISDDEDMWRPW